MASEALIGAVVGLVLLIVLIYQLVRVRRRYRARTAAREQSRRPGYRCEACGKTFGEQARARRHAFDVHKAPDTAAADYLLARFGGAE